MSRLKELNSNIDKAVANQSSKFGFKLTSTTGLNAYKKKWVKWMPGVGIGGKGAWVDTNPANKVKHAIWDDTYKKKILKDIDASRDEVQAAFSARNRKLLTGSTTPLKDALYILRKDAHTANVESFQKGPLHALRRRLSKPTVGGGRNLDALTEQSNAAEELKIAEQFKGTKWYRQLNRDAIKKAEEGINNTSVIPQETKGEALIRQQTANANNALEGQPESVQNSAKKLTQVVEETSGEKTKVIEPNTEAPLPTYDSVLKMKRGKERDRLTLEHWTKKGYDLTGFKGQDARRLANELRIGHAHEMSGSAGTFLHINPAFRGAGTTIKRKTPPETE